MLKSLVNRVFGTRHDRERRRVQPIVDEVNREYERLQGVSDEELRGQTAKFRALLAERTAALDARVAELKAAKHAAADAAEREAIDTELSGADGRGGVEGELRDTVGEVLDEILPEAFATAREAARRLCGTTVRVTGREFPWDMVHYDVQLIGGFQLHDGKIAEMATGEGKTLVATLPLYLNALAGRGGPPGPPRADDGLRAEVRAHAHRDEVAREVEPAPHRHRPHELPVEVLRRPVA